MKHAPLRLLVLLVLCTGIVTGPASSDSGDSDAGTQRMMPVGHPVYGQLQTLAMETGRRLPALRQPCSAAELLQLLQSIPTNQLSAAGRQLVIRIEESLGPKAVFSSGNFSFLSSPRLALEGYYSSAADNVWKFSYERRSPLLNIPLEIGIAELAWLQIDLTIKEEYRAISEDSANYSNIPTALTYLDWYFPFRAYGALGGDWWSLQFGRDRLNWGNGLSGNLILSGNVDFHDFAQGSLYWDWFSFTSLYAVLDPWLTPEEVAIWNNPAQTNAGWYPNYNELYKAFTAHRFDFSLGQRARIAITEACLYGNKYPQLNDLNPFMIMHNYFIPERGNSMFGLEIDVSPWKYFSLSGQFALDEFETSYEEGKGARPGATAWLVNTRLALPLGKSYLQAFAEYGHIAPWMYNRWHPNTRFTSRRRIWSYIPPDGYEWVTKPLGHAAGPDSDLFYAGASWQSPLPAGLQLNTGAEYQWLRHSNITLDTAYNLYQSADELRTLWRYDQTVELYARLQLPWNFETWGNVLLCWYENYSGEAGRNEFRLEVAGGISWEY